MSIDNMLILDSSKKLSLSHSAYKKAVQLYVWQAYLNDLGEGDITTQYFIPQRHLIVTTEIVVNESGILAGIMEAEWFLRKLGIQIVRKKKEGSALKEGDVIMKLKGPADKILGCERTLLNLLQRMSGVATATNRMASKLPTSIRLLATRKTLWGDLDKRAVAVGGGATHRLNLSDAVLIKDNHLALVDDWENRLKKVFRKAPTIRFVEIELQNLQAVFKFRDMCHQTAYPKNLAVMLDNFSPAQAKKAVSILKELGIFIEISGGINEKNIKKYAIHGIFAISSGSITNKAASLDFSLNILI